MPIIIPPDGFEDSEEDHSAQLGSLLLNLKEYLRTHYKPAADPAEADCHYTTQEIYSNLLAVLPNTEVLQLSHVAAWLTELGFSFFDYGNMRLEWMMKKL